MVPITIALLLILLAYWRFKLSCQLQAEALALEAFIIKIEGRYQGGKMPHDLFLAIKITDDLFDISDRESSRGVSPWTLAAFKKRTAKARAHIAEADQRALNSPSSS